MKRCVADPAIWLLDTHDLTQAEVEGVDLADLETARAAAAWAQSYLAQPHPDLGRAGLVCPFVPRALASSMFFCAVRRGGDLSPSDIAATVARYRDWFMALEPHDGPMAQYKTILILFPDILDEDLARLIDGPQAALKHSFVEQGLMIGQFHNRPPDSPGLWNPAFRPLVSDIPMLVIRNMVSSDLPFLTSAPEFLSAYQQRFGDRLTARQRQMITEVAGEAREGRR
jgi:hypothetical protein